MSRPETKAGLNTAPSTAPTPLPALLLLGPTGSGKTPLGAALEGQGLGGRRCLHFDFGAELRRAAASGGSDRSGVSDTDRAFIRRVLEEGALLEPEDFPVAERVLRAFLARRGAGHLPARSRPRPPPSAQEDEGRGQGTPILVLNGLPRHVQQAEALQETVDVRAVAELRCTPGTVFRRIRANAGGDRIGRVDDDEALVRKKLTLYADRTAPLVQFYRKRGVPVVPLSVSAETKTEDVREAILRSGSPL